MPELIRWFHFLSARLRHVRIVNGDWQRVCTGGATKTINVRQGKGSGKESETCGMFLDPPYADTAGRDNDLYAEEDLDVAHRVATWAIENGDDPMYRIVLAGYQGEHADKFKAEGWKEIEWFKAGYLRGGMGNTGKGHQQARERLWLSPHCILDTKPVQASMF